MKDCKPALTPYISGTTIENLFAKDEEEKNKYYPFVNKYLGHLRYIVNCRMEITGPLHVLSLAAHKPGKKCELGVKKIIRYLRGTIDLPLIITNKKGYTKHDLRREII